MDVLELTRETPDAEQEAVGGYYGEQQRAVRRDLPVDPPQYTVARWLNPPAFWPGRVWYARRAGAVCGVVYMDWSVGPDNVERVDCDLTVDDEEVARALAAAVVEFAAAHAKTVIGVETVAGTRASDAVRSLGGRIGSVEEWNVIRTADAPTADIREWARSFPTGYSPVGWSGDTPDEWLDDQVRLLETMNTAPRDELTYEDVVWTPERVRQADASIRARGVELWTSCARHDATGRLVAFTALEVAGGRPALADQGDTAVVPEHRGHGLGLAVKSVNLARLLDEAPQAVAVQTWNSTTNRHMIAVNRRLGARCLGQWQEWEFDRDALAAALRH